MDGDLPVLRAASWVKYSLTSLALMYDISLCDVCWKVKPLVTEMVLGSSTLGESLMSERRQIS